MEDVEDENVVDVNQPTDEPQVEVIDPVCPLSSPVTKARIVFHL